MKRWIKKEYIWPIIGVLVALVVVMGVSYALFTTTATGNKNNVINAGTLRLTFADGSSNTIDLTSAVPVTDETGMKGTAYTFTIQNTGTLTARYQLKIEENQATYTAHNDAEKIFADYKLKLGITKGETTTYQLYNRTAIDTGTLAGGASVTYTIRIWIDYNAGNEVQGNHFHGKFTLKAEQDYGPYQDESGANSPELADNMIPVVYSETNGRWEKADLTKEWHNYSKQQWANAVTVTSTNRSTYLNAAPGTEIPMSEINTMWVWIPRYEYKIVGTYGTHLDGTAGTTETPGEIETKFILKSKTSADNGYILHPAFTFGMEQLSGIWVGKFETGYLQSGDESTWTTAGAQQNVTTANKILIKPNIYSWRNIQVANAYTVSRTMTASGNVYGLPSSVDTHMMKNSEWGTVAYLSQSRYGKYGNSMYIGDNKQIYKNNTNSYKTGCSTGLTNDASMNTSTCNSYNTLTDRGNGQGRIGGGASTTGNITGIYDMYGGSGEYTMSNYNRYVGSSSYNSGFTGTLSDGTNYTGISFPESKYYDLYITSDSQTACSNNKCYGDAIAETNGWYYDFASIPSSSYPWSLRDGSWGYSSSGIFYASGHYGSAMGSATFRLVLKTK